MSDSGEKVKSTLTACSVDTSRRDEGLRVQAMEFATRLAPHVAPGTTAVDVADSIFKWLKDGSKS